MYSLQFKLSIDKSSKLLLGNLLLFKEGEQGKELINNFIATSSIRGKQYQDSWLEKGGLIPPGAYNVKVTPILMENVKGVEGNFYCILPFEVPTKGALRGDFGIHKDANSPGSLGCIVLPTSRGWSAFERSMKEIAQDTIPLAVSYK